LTPEAVYPYVDETGELLFEVCRMPDKRFVQRRRNGDGDGYAWTLNGTRRVLFHLPRVLEHITAASREPLYIVEGEKDVLAIEAAGGVATCNPMGAGKWTAEYSEPLTGARRVVIVADRDDPGIRHAQNVRDSLAAVGVAAEIVQAAAGKDAADHLAAGKTLEDLLPLAIELPATPSESGSHSWAPVDLIGEALTPPEPATIGSLAYPSRRHVFSGEPESLKSFVALVLCADEMHAGHTVFYIDFEMGRRDVLERLRQLGVDDETIASRFVYLEPTEPLTDPTVLADVVALVEERQPSLVVIDAMTGALGLHGFDPNSGVDIERFYRTVVDVFRAHGAATIVLDHLPKDREARGKFAIGSERKIGAVDVHLRFEAVRPFGRGRTGLARIEVKKDRPGHLPRGKAAELELASNPDTGHISWKLTISEQPADDPLPWRPTLLMQRVSEHLETQPEPVSRNAVETGVKGKAQYIRKALEILIREGYVSESLAPTSSQTPGRTQTRLVASLRPYRQTEKSHLVPSSQLRPASSQDELDEPSVTSSPPYKKGDEGRSPAQDLFSDPGADDDIPF
jgi:5S rRNA maturation endonuclease (ribonuclease M5)